MLPAPLSKFKKPIVGVALVAFLAFSIVWLWQRQPKSPIKQVLSQTTQVAKEIKQDLEKIQITSPKDQSIVTLGKVTVSGKTNPNTYVAILTSPSAAITKTASDGTFQKEIELTDGLNLIVIDVVSSDKEDITKSLTLWYDKKNTKSFGSAILAGTVKSLFDTNITISTLSGGKNIQTSKSTEFDIPSADEEKQATTSAIKDVRVGDFAIGLGDPKDENTITAKKVIIIRENKPKVDKLLIQAKLLSAPIKNTLSAKNLKDQNINELTINKSTDFSLDGKDAKIEDVKKDMNALIISHPESDKKIVDLIYLLP